MVRCGVLTIDYAELLAERIGVRPSSMRALISTSAIAKALQHTVDGMLNAYDNGLPR
jgi:hypothetical protein